MMPCKICGNLDCTCAKSDPPEPAATCPVTASMDADPGKLSGRPCLRGTRMPVAQILVSLFDCSGKEYADDYDIDPDLLKSMLQELAWGYSKPRRLSPPPSEPPRPDPPRPDPPSGINPSGINPDRVILFGQPHPPRPDPLAGMSVRAIVLEIVNLTMDSAYQTQRDTGSMSSFIVDAKLPPIIEALERRLAAIADRPLTPDVRAALARYGSVNPGYFPVYPGGQKQFDEDCQILAAALAEQQAGRPGVPADVKIYAEHVYNAGMIGSENTAKAAHELARYVLSLAADRGKA